MKVFALHEGSYSVDNTKKFITFDPAVHNPKDRPGSLFIHVNPFLVKTEKDLIVLDTGLGYTDENKKLILHENIRKAGYDPDDVTLVLMSHLHYDHSGGIVFNKDEHMGLSFPNAEYIVQRAEWEMAYSKPSRSYRTEIFDVLQRSGNLRFVEGNGRLNDQISFELSGGHSEFHQVFLIEEGGEAIFFGGDELPEPEQLLRKFMAKYDFNARKAMELREEYGKRAAAGNWTCLFYHAKSQPVGKVAYDDGAFKINAV